MKLQLGQPHIIYLGSRVSLWESKIKPSGERTVVPFRSGRKYVTIALVHEANVLKIPVRERRSGFEDIYVADGIFQAGRMIMKKRWPDLLEIMKKNAVMIDKINKQRRAERSFLMKWPREDYKVAIRVLEEFIDGNK